MSKLLVKSFTDACIKLSWLQNHLKKITHHFARLVFFGAKSQ